MTRDDKRCVTEGGPLKRWDDVRQMEGDFMRLSGRPRSDQSTPWLNLRHFHPMLVRGGRSDSDRNL